MPVAADLFCGLGGWTEGLAAEGWHCRGYDIEAHEYGDEKYPGEFVQRDILQMHGSEIADVDLIVSSSPCQAYSYMAMPWSIAKAKAASIRADETGQTLRDLNALFDAQFRIQREASEAAGRYIPMVVENVRGAQPWVGRARGNYGSFYLWGDVPALMPSAYCGRKNPGFRFDGSGRSFQSESVARHVDGMKNETGGSWFGKAPRGAQGEGNTPGIGCSSRRRGCPPSHQPKAARARARGAAWFDQNISSLPSSSPRRKAASAKIAKIPLNLSRHIGMIYHPDYS